MKSMDIFAGCGGLSEGMHQVGLEARQAGCRQAASLGGNKADFHLTAQRPHGVRPPENKNWMSTSKKPEKVQVWQQR
jgi:hypothetical protein